MWAPAPEDQRRLTRKEFDAFVDNGFFHGEHIELIHGILVRMSPTGTPHSALLQRLNKLFVFAVGDHAGVRIQSPFGADELSEPEPDLAVTSEDTMHAHPEKAFLLVEVADSSLKFDRTVKAALYAACGVPEYWSVNVQDKCIERYLSPRDGRYQALDVIPAGSVVQLTALPQVSVNLAGFFD